MKEVTIAINEDELWALSQAHEHFKNLHYSEMNRKVDPNLQPQFTVQMMREIEQSRKYHLEVCMSIKNVYHTALGAFENNKMETQEGDAF